MPREYYSILGLAPGRYAAREITRRFQALRAHLDEAGDTGADAARAQREDLYLAYAALREPRRQAAYLHGLQNGTTPIRELRRMIAASIEDDLLRHSRRETLLDEGRRIGLSEFQTQLLIAEVQFGERLLGEDESAAIADPSDETATSRPDRLPLRPATRLAAAGALAVALVVLLQRWLAP